MAKVQILEVLQEEKPIKQGSDEKHLVWQVFVQESFLDHETGKRTPQGRKFKFGLGKASAAELQFIRDNVGAIVELELGEMVQQNKFAFYFKTNGEYEVLVPKPRPAIHSAAIPPKQ